jgi:hypothetical protein
MRRVVAKRIEERGRTRAHRRWRIWMEELAGRRISDERLRQFGGVSCRKKKGGRGRSFWSIYRWRLSCEGG